MQVIHDFPHVRYERDCVDRSAFPGIILVDIHNSFVDHPRSSDDDVALLLSHRCCRIRVHDCSNRTLGIRFGIHDPNVGQYLSVEERFVDC